MSLFAYNSKKLIPAPFVAVQKQYNRTGDGSPIGSTFQISIRGTIVAFKGSPSSSGTFHTISGYPADETISSDSRLGSLLRKQEAIRELFSNDGLTLEWQSADGTASMKCNPRITDINFTDGIWFDKTEYNINCESEVLYVNGTAVGEDEFPEYVSEATEEWSTETDDDLPESVESPRSYRLSHSISAKGKRFHSSGGSVTKPAWQWARDWVLPRLGFDNDIALSSGVIKLPSYYGGYNHSRNETVNEGDGTFSVVETWLLSSGTALEDYNVSINTNNDTGLTNVKIDGEIRGLEERNSSFTITDTKYSNASSHFNQVSGLILTRAQNYSDLTLNIEPLSTSVGRNPARGTISYSWEYDDRPSNLIPTSKRESIQISDTLDTNLFARVFVLGRGSKGSVKQDLGVNGDLQRGLTIELVMPKNSFGGGTESEVRSVINNNPRINPVTSGAIQTIISAANPESFNATVLFVADQTESWNPITSQYQYSIAWIYEL